MNKLYIYGGIAILVIAVIGGLISASLIDNQSVGTTNLNQTRYPNSGLAMRYLTIKDTKAEVDAITSGTDGDLIVDGAVTFSSTLALSGVATFDSEVFYSDTLATTTTGNALSYAMRESDLQHSSIQFNPTYDISLTTPASSTITSWIPNSGDVAVSHLTNRSATSSVVTFVAWAGWYINTATTTLKLYGIEKAEASCERLATTDIICQLFND